MEKLLETSVFETSKKGRKAPKKPIGWVLCFLRFLFNLALILVALSFLVVSGAYGYVIYAHGDQLGRTYPDLAQNSSVYDANGDRIGELKAKENRRTVGPEGLGEYLPQAVVAIEDRRFHELGGRISPGSRERRGRTCARSP